MIVAHRSFTIVALTTVVAACASRSPSTPAPPLAQSPACDSLVARSAADPTQPVDVMPEPDSLFLPPEPRPRSIRGQQALAEFIVDPAGRPTRIIVSGLSDQKYAERLHAVLQRTHFIPARRGECRVFAVGRLTLKF